MTAKVLAAILFCEGDDCMDRIYQSYCLGMKKSMMKYAIYMLLFCATVLGLGMEVNAATVVSTNGALKVEGTKLVSQKTGKEVQLRGVSTHGINWDVGYPYISKEAFKTLRDKYSVNAIRLAMYTTDYYGYCDKCGAGESQETVQSTLKSRIQPRQLTH